jgi:hypothetical protein
MGQEIQDLQVIPFDLGDNNIGAFGPNEDELPHLPRYIDALARPEYSKLASDEWTCVDGRCSERELAEIADGSIPEAARPQIAGSKVTTDVAAEMMGTPGTVHKRSVLNAEKTRENIKNGQRIIVHGDTFKNKAGCIANAEIRAVLHFNAANTDIVAPVVWSGVKAAGLDTWVTGEDVASAIMNGKINADNEELWDVTAERAVDIQVENGAEYEELLGSHGELLERIDLSDGAFAKATYVRDHSYDGKQRQAFSASVGRYKTIAFEIAANEGRTERDAAIQVMRAIAYNVGISKMLKNDRMPVAAVTPVA